MNHGRACGWRGARVVIPIVKGIHVELYRTLNSAGGKGVCMCDFSYFKLPAMGDCPVRFARHKRYGKVTLFLTWS